MSVTAVSAAATAPMSVIVRMASPPVASQRKKMFESALSSGDLRSLFCGAPKKLFLLREADSKRRLVPPFIAS
jgi:hypothetical protein